MLEEPREQPYIFSDLKAAQKKELERPAVYTLATIGGTAAAFDKLKTVLANLISNEELEKNGPGLANHLTAQMDQGKTTILKTTKISYLLAEELKKQLQGSFIIQRESS